MQKLSSFDQRSERSENSLSELFISGVRKTMAVF